MNITCFGKPTKLLASTLCILILFATKSISQSVRKIRIDPDKAYGGTVSEYFESVEYIPLETNKESLLGDIDKLIVTDSSYIILDFDTQAIYFFDLTGKFIAKAAVVNGLYPDVQFDQFTNSIVLSYSDPTSYQRQFRDYSIVGSLLRGVSDNKKINTESLSTMLNLGDSYMAMLSGCDVHRREVAKDSVFHMINIYKNGLLHKQYLPMNQKENLGFCSFGGNFGNTQGTMVKKGAFYIAMPLWHTVYQVDKDSIKGKFQFVFPANRSIPDKIISSKDKKVVDSAWYALEKSEDIIVGVTNISLNGNHLFFKIRTYGHSSTLGSEGTKQHNFIYDTITGKLVSMERITADEGSSYLPILGAGDAAAVRGLIFSNGYLYSQLSSLQMFAAKEQAKNKNHQYPPALQEYFKTQNRKSNPVIVKLKLKE